MSKRKRPSQVWGDWAKSGGTVAMGVLRPRRQPLTNGVRDAKRSSQRGCLAGFAIDDGAALHFVNGSLHRVVASRANARAYLVELEHGVVRETPIVPDQLGA